MIFFSDFHFHNHPTFALPWEDGCNTRMREQVTVLRSIFEWAYAHGERELIFAGDLFHTWMHVSTPVKDKVTDALYGLMNAYRAMRLTMIPGNHDLPDKSAPHVNAISAFDAHPRITVVDAPALRDIEGVPVVMVPYYDDPQRVLDGVRSKSAGLDDAVLVAHPDIVGASTGIAGYTATTGLEVEALAGCVKGGGFFGHYHMPQDLGAGFHYIGSPLQLDPINADEDHGFMVLQRDTGDVSRVPLDSPRFVHVDQDTDVRTLRTQDYHMVRCPAGYSEDVRAAYKGLYARVLPTKVERTVSIPTGDAASADADPLEAYFAHKLAGCSTDVIHEHVRQARYFL